MNEASSLLEKYKASFKLYYFCEIWRSAVLCTFRRLCMLVMYSPVCMLTVSLFTKKLIFRLKNCPVSIFKALTIS